MRLALPLLLLGASLAHAAPSAKDAIARGRALAKKSDYSAAIRAFQEALGVDPDDPTALSELGLAAFRAGDFPLAVEISQRAVAVAPTPLLRGASLYNLGRAQESLGQTDRAVDSYRRSYTDRPNRIVRERLLALDPEMTASLDPVSPQPLDGPYANLADFCGKPADCDRGYACAPAPLRPAPARIVVFQSTCADGEDAEVTLLHLGFQHDGKWWVAPGIEESLESSRQRETHEVTKLEAKGALFLVSTHATFTYQGQAQAARRKLRILGVGKSGRPHITPPILFDYLEEANQARLEPVILPDGQLDVRGPFRVRGRGIPKEVLDPLLGKHPLVFP
jgi:tetratricopeptide (TPR) repeat protein